MRTPLGTSSTLGGGSTGTAAFRGPLETLLIRDGVAFDMIGSQHSGPPSCPTSTTKPTTDGGTHAELVAGRVVAAHPDVILLQVGTDDLARRHRRGRDRGAARHHADDHPSVLSALVVVARVWAPLPTRRGGARSRRGRRPTWRTGTTIELRR